MTFGAVRQNLANATFSPRDLFIGGATGFWYDPSDLNAMWQTSTGTTAVTADGDPVGFLVDKSGNGNNAIRSTSDAARPVWKRDVNNGTAWLLCTSGAIGTGLGIANTALIQNKRYWTLIVGFNYTAFDLGFDQDLFDAGTGAGAARCDIEQGAGAAGVIRTRARTLDADAGASIIFPLSTAGDDHVVVIDYNYGDQNGIIFQNHSLLASTYGTYPASAGATSNTASTAIEVVAVNPASPGPSFGGRLYGMIGIDRILTQGERLRISAWMMHKIGKY